VPESKEVVQTSVRFPALDGYTLAGSLFVPSGPRTITTAALISGGGGILAARYARFAWFLATRGITVLTYDYRGIGGSRPAEIRRLNAVAEDWSELDCGGAIAYLRVAVGGAQLVGIAHSIGALITGGAPNTSELTRFVFICPHTGYYGDYLPRYRLPMAVVWHGLMPLLTRVFGYFPASVLRLGEDIPAGVALQWAARRSPDLRPEATTNDASRARSMMARYRSVTGTALVLGFRDDAFATSAGIRRLLAGFPALDSEVTFIAPSDGAMRSIGHFGFFRREAAALWARVVPFIQDHPQSRLPTN